MIWHDHHVKISLIVISNNNTYYSNMNYRMIVIRRTIYIYIYIYILIIVMIIVMRTVMTMIMMIMTIPMSMHSNNYSSTAVLITTIS